MANPNIKPTITTSERGRELALKSVEARRKKAAERKAMKHTLDTLLRMSVRSGTFVSDDQIKDLAEAGKLNVDVQTAINIAVIQRAMMGDIQAVQFIRDTIGEKPSDKVEVDQSLTIEEWAKNHKPKL